MVWWFQCLILSQTNLSIKFKFIKGLTGSLTGSMLPNSMKLIDPKLQKVSLSTVESVDQKVHSIDLKVQSVDQKVQSVDLKFDSLMHDLINRLKDVGISL